MNIDFIISNVAINAGEASDPFMQFVPILLIIGIMYFVVFLPEKKARREREDFVKNLKPGSQVLVSNSIFGKVSQVTDDSCVVDVGSNTKLRVVKSQVTIAPEKEKNNAKESKKK